MAFFLKRTSDDTISLKLRHGFRILFALLWLVILGTVLVSGGGKVSPVAPVLLFLFGLILLYEESWVFNRTEGTIYHFHGLVFLKRTRIFHRDDVDALVVSSFRKGSISAGEEKRRFFQKDLIRFSLFFRDGVKKDIEITEAKHEADLQQKATEIANFMNISYGRDL